MENDIRQRLRNDWTTIITNGNNKSSVSTTLRKQLAKMQKTFSNYQLMLSNVEKLSPLLIVFFFESGGKHSLMKKNSLEQQLVRSEVILTFSLQKKIEKELRLLILSLF